MRKNIVQPIKTLIRLFSHVKNKVCSEIRILFRPNTTRKSLYSYNKRPYDITLIYAAYAKCKIQMAYAAYAKIQNKNDFFMEKVRKYK